jgi:hypothetical protein
MSNNPIWNKIYRSRPEVKLRIAARGKEYRNRPEIKLQYRNSRLKRLYNITLEEYNNILIKQKNICPICNKPLDFTILKSIHLDHSHKTGKVRGIVHNNCNYILSRADENINTLTNAIKYLQKHSPSLLLS